MTRVKIEVGGDTMEISYNEQRPVRLQDMLCALERAILVEALRHHGQIKARAAEALSLLRTTLVEKVKKYEITI